MTSKAVATKQNFEEVIENFVHFMLFCTYLKYLFF